MMRVLAASVLLILLGQAHAAAIMHAQYDPEHDWIVAEIAYRGISAKHQFSAQWSECDRSTGDVPQVSARLVDNQGSEPANKDYRVTQRFSVARLDECRPAQITLRLGRGSLATVDVPPPRRIAGRTIAPAPRSSTHCALSDPLVVARFD